MYVGRTVFSQLMDALPLHEFQKCVERYRGNYKVRSFSCLDQYLCMAFAQLTYRESLRDIEVCLRSMQNKLYHMGIRGRVSRSTLAEANENRDWRIYADFAQVLIPMARELYAGDPFGVELKQTVYALDSTIISLCLSLFPWATVHQYKRAIKIHTLIDVRGNIPTFIRITDGRIQDMNILDEVVPEPGSIYVMDRGYLDYARLYSFTQHAAFFVIRAKSNLRFRRVYSHPVDKSTGLRCDQTIQLTGLYTAKGYPDQLRRICYCRVPQVPSRSSLLPGRVPCPNEVRACFCLAWLRCAPPCHPFSAELMRIISRTRHYFDAKENKHLTFLTNVFWLPALTICELYRCRWQVELFFKWIKQHLRIKAFYGTSENAVKTQIWIAISTYVLVAIAKKRLNLEHSLYTILQILSVTMFEKRPILQVFSEPNYTNHDGACSNQLNLFDL
jgi:hypothetical protein